MLKNLAKISLVSLLSIQAIASYAESNKSNVYIEGHGGISLPAGKLKHKEYKLTGVIKRSPVYGGAIGYRVSEHASLELLFDHRDKYKVDIWQDGIFNKTSYRSSSAMLNVVYNLPSYGLLEPYVSIGAGIAKVKIKKKVINDLEYSSTINNPMELAGLQMLSAVAGDAVKLNGNKADFNLKNAPFGEISAKTSNSLTWQIGIGANIPVTDSITFGLGANFQVIHDVKASLVSLDSDVIKKHLATIATGNADKIPQSELKYKTKNLKKTLGVYEIMGSVKFNLPF